MRYYSKGLPWAHGLGTKVDDCKTAREVMEKAGLDFSVNKCELVAKMPFSINGSNVIGDGFTHNGNIYREVPSAFATYRTDMNIPLGIVKDKYTVVQNMEVFNFFDDAIGEGKAQWQYAGLMGYGHKIYVTAKIPVESRVGNDPVDHYLVFSNSHDGTASVDIMFTPIRVFCTNVLNAAFRSADCHIRLKHTKNVGNKIEQGGEILHIACQYAESATELYNSLTYIKMNDNTVMDYFAKLILSEAEYDALSSIEDENATRKLFYRDYLVTERIGVSTRKTNILNTMFDYYQNGVAQKEIVGTAWGAYNAVTGYYSNVANTEGERRLDTLVWGSANNTMLKALNNAVTYKEAV